jgi:glycogen phosphorylase
VFIEDYDFNVARYLVRGVDVWLNTPLRPHEASGTSGQKAAINGALNLSILDGWWCEGYNGKNGWAIGDENVRGDQNEQDNFDAESLYSLLEKEVVPTYYERNGNGLPNAWAKKMKESIRTLAPVYNTDRMLKDYFNNLYAPAIEAASENEPDAGLPRRPNM